MEFEKRLRSARMERGLTQSALADIIGISLRSYQCYEQGTRRPPYETLIALADELNLSLDYLLGRDQFLENR